jgi:hypothetical protein
MPKQPHLVFFKILNGFKILRFTKKIGASVTFQDLSYNMLPKKIQFFFEFFLLKKGLSANLAAQTTHFQYKCNQIY